MFYLLRWQRWELALSKVQKPKHLSHPPQPCHTYQQGAESEVRQLGLEPAPTSLGICLAWKDKEDWFSPHPTCLGPGPAADWAQVLARRRGQCGYLLDRALGAQAARTAATTPVHGTPVRAGPLPLLCPRSEPPNPSPSLEPTPRHRQGSLMQEETNL